MFIITTVFVRLQTTILSGFLGRKCTLLTFTLPPAADPPKDLNVFRHSVVFVFHIFTVPSDDPLEENRYIKKFDVICKVSSTNSRLILNLRSDPQLYSDSTALQYYLPDNIMPIWTKHN